MTDHGFEMFVRRIRASLVLAWSLRWNWDLNPRCFWNSDGVMSENPVTPWISQQIKLLMTISVAEVSFEKSEPIIIFFLRHIWFTEVMLLHVQRLESWRMKTSSLAIKDNDDEEEHERRVYLWRWCDGRRLDEIKRNTYKRVGVG